MSKRLWSAFLVAAMACVGCAPGENATPPDAPSRVEPKSGWAEVGAGRLHYEVRGSGDAIVFVHGNVGDLRHWDHQVDALAADFRVIRYDVRGYGKSSNPVDGEAYADHEDLAALLDHLDVSKAHVAGWSMGAGIATDFVLAYPERAISLISVGPWVGGHSSPAVQALFADMGAVAEAFSRGGAPAALQAWREAPFWVATARDPAAEAEFARIAADYSWWAFSHTSAKRDLEPPAAQRLGSISVPTLIMTAEHDIPACLEIADLLDKSVPDSRKVVLKGTGHLLHIERPADFNQHLLAFTKGVATQPAAGG